MKFILKILKADPFEIYNYILSVLGGYYCRIKYSVLSRKAVFGKGFRVRGPFTISGPGKVVIGDHVTIEGRGHPVTPFTHHKSAVITIGHNSFVNGARFGCQQRISIGPRAILGDVRIMDTDFHSVNPDRWSKEALVESAPVEIGENVWIGAAAAVLKGVKIGDHSVVGYGSVVSRDVPSYAVVAGNPARVVKILKNAQTAGSLSHVV